MIGGAPRLSAWVAAAFFVATTVAAGVATRIPHAQAAAPPLQLARGDGSPAVVLLGEVHDNAAQHALRLEAFRALLASGARPALLMEQLDREHQGDIDRARAGAVRIDADTLIAAAAGSKQWNWAFYRPFIELALAHDLPLLAGNVSRQDTQRVMAQGLAESGFDAKVPPEITQAHAAEIEASHCGMVNAAQAQRMASAQVARDQFMARQVDANAARGVVLLAGNGHVRIDTGVPRWLSAATRARSTAIGFLEEGDDASTTRYDRVITTPRQPREDPCAAMHQAVPAESKS